MHKVRLNDRQFSLFISEEEIIKGVDRVAEKINAEYETLNPLFICVLNGAFMFASDLLKRVHVTCEIIFVKMASYEGTSSSGSVKTLIGLDESVRKRHAVLIEDIVDTGNTIETITSQLLEYGPESIRVCTLLFKPEAYTKSLQVDYTALEIPNRFVVGYGLDYDGLGRNLKDIYVLDGNDENVPNRRYDA